MKLGSFSFRALGLVILLGTLWGCLSLYRGETRVRVLLVAARDDDLPRVRALLNQGVRKSAISSAAVAAATGGNEDVLRFLLDRGADPEVRSLHGDPLFDLALRMCGPDAARQVLLRGAHPQPLYLSRAARFGAPDLVRYLLARGMDPNSSPLDEAGPLEAAAGALRPHHAGALAAARILLAAGSAVDRGQSALRKTALMIAAESGNRSMVHLLLEHGADPQLRDENGRRASELAERKGYLDLALRLRRLTPGMPSHQSPAP